MFAVITNIGYDHQFMLGDTLLEIAHHKVGIVKENVPLFTTEQNKEILSYFKDYCTKHQSTFYPLQVEKQYQYPYHLHFHQKEYVLHLPTYQVSNFNACFKCC